MPHTDGRWTSGTSFPDLQQFIGADEFALLAGTAPLPSSIATPGLLFRTCASASAVVLAKSLSELLLRSGVYATPQYDQEQYGTAASVPGPSAVAGTNGPLALPGSGSPYYQGFPPIPGASMATLAGPVTGPSQKGIQIDSVDVIYQTLTAAATVATIGLTKTNFANLVAPVVTNIIALGNNSLPLTVAAQPVVKNVAVTTPAMIVASDTDVLLNLNFTAGAGGTLVFYGAVIKAHYNLQ